VLNWFCACRAISSGITLGGLLELEGSHRFD